MPDDDEVSVLVAVLRAERLRRRTKNPVEYIWEGRAKKKAAAVAKRNAEREVERKANVVRRNKQPPFGDRLRDKWARIMLPGHWYAMRDLATATGHGKGNVVGMWKYGLVERARGPEAANRYKPQWLYRLTKAGMELKEALELLGP